MTLMIFTPVNPAKKGACDKAVETHNNAKINLTKIVKKIFALFVSFLDESFLPVYNEIVATKVDITPWTNLRG